MAYHYCDVKSNRYHAELVSLRRSQYIPNRPSLKALRERQITRTQTPGPRYNP